MITEQVPSSDQPRAWSISTLPLRPSHYAAAVIWLVGCYTTWLFVAVVAVAPILVTVFAALVLQTVLSIVEWPFWSRRHRNAVSGLAVVVDSAINAGGIWPLVLRFEDTPTWRMFATALELDPRFALVPALVVSLALGFWLAAAPERIWRW